MQLCKVNKCYESVENKPLSNGQIYINCGSTIEMRLYQMLNIEMYTMVLNETPLSYSYTIVFTQLLQGTSRILVIVQSAYSNSCCIVAYKNCARQRDTV